MHADGTTDQREESKKECQLGRGFTQILADGRRLYIEMSAGDLRFGRASPRAGRGSKELPEFFRRIETIDRDVWNTDEHRRKRKKRQIFLSVLFQFFFCVFPVFLFPET